jgi:hypothetical protein
MGGGLSTATSTNTGGASETSGDNGGEAGCSCSLAGGSPGLLGLFGLAALSIPVVD